MSERFVYVSLLGLCIIIAYLVSEKLSIRINHIQKYKKYATTIIVLILIGFSIKTISRNTVWENNLTLFENDIHTSVNSAKGNSTYASELYKLSEDAEVSGDTLTRNKYLKQSIPYFEKAIELHPNYSEALVRLGNIHYKLNGDYKTMFLYYIRTLENNPLNADVWNNTLGVLTYNVNDLDYEKEIWQEFIKYAPQRADPYFQIGNLYYFAQTPNPDSAIHYFEVSKKITKKNFELLFQLGVSYGNIQQFENARENLLQAASIKEDSEVYRYIGITYGMEQNDIKALEYFEKALALNPDNEQLKQNIAIAKQRISE